MVILDTSFIFAFFNQKDEFHGKAHQILEILGKQPLFVSFLVYQELLTLMMARFSSEAAVELSNELFSEDYSVQLLKIDEEYFEDSQALFKQLSPHKFSFVDISLMVLSKNLEAKVLTFDRNLEKTLAFK